VDLRQLREVVGVTSEFDHEKCRQHVCHGCFRYFWTFENYDVDVSCPYCGENPHHPARRGEHNIFGDTLVVEGDFDDPEKPDGDVYQLENSRHRYEMGVTHDCGVADCPANVGGRDD